jgi:hypothetical protein
MQMAADSLPEWQIAMENTTNLAGVLSGALDHMNANLRTAEAGKTQLALAERWPGWMNEVAAEGKRLSAKWNPRFNDQASGLAAAGGKEEVYRDAKAATPAQI